MSDPNTAAMGGADSPARKQAATKSIVPTLVMVFALVITGGGIVVLFLLSQIDASRSEAHRILCQSNIRMVAVALHTYHDVYGSLPPAYIADENGKPMHSWRVLILPYLEGNNIYRQYRFDEPWDGPNNKKLHKFGNRILQCPSDANLQNADYMVVVGPETMFPGEQARSLFGVADGTSNTIMLVEVVDSTAHWMEPRDLDFYQAAQGVYSKQGESLSSSHGTGVSVAFADLHVVTLSETIAPDMLRAFLTATGGETILDD